MGEKIKLFEMFAGYGGASFALKKANIPFECVGTSEIDKKAMMCYTHNHQGFHYGDCTKINPNKLQNFDLLTAGFPCQAFSQAGKGMGELDTRGTLFNEIIRIAEVKKPKFILLENVKGLTTNKHKHTFDKILDELDRIGYYVQWKILNSKDYGTPQSRERVWFVCTHKSEFESYLDDQIDWFVFPKKEELKIFFKDLLKDLPFREIPKFQYGFYRGRKRIDMLKTTNDKIFHTLTINRSHQNQYLLNPTKDKCRLFDKQEVFRLMGFFNDEIDLTNLSHNDAHRLAGNGWDINVASKILKNMLQKSANKKYLI